MSSVKIIDNLLSEDEFNHFFAVMNNEHFPWYKGEKIRENSIPLPSPVKGYDCIELFQEQLSHLLVDEIHGNNSHLYWEACTPIAKKLDIEKVYRAKLNLTYSSGTQTVGGWHRDIDAQSAVAKHVDIDKDINVAIFYLNTNNGFTLLEDGTKVMSKANRLAIHKNLLHTDVTQTDTETRLVFNLVYD